MEELADTLSLDVDFTSLRQSMQALQAASVRLDVEKAEAEANLRKSLGKLLQHKIYRIICKLLKYIGKECKRHEKGEPSCV